MKTAVLPTATSWERLSSRRNYVITLDTSRDSHWWGAVVTVISRVGVGICYNSKLSGNQWSWTNSPTGFQVIHSALWPQINLHVIDRTSVQQSLRNIYATALDTENGKKVHRLFYALNDSGAAQQCVHNVKLLVAKRSCCHKQITTCDFFLHKCLKLWILDLHDCVGVCLMWNKTKLCTHRHRKISSIRCMY